MKRKVKAPPDRLIAEAMSFMVDGGATVVERSENSVTFAVPGNIGGWDAGGLLLMAFSDWAAFSTEAQTLESRKFGANRPQTTLIATPTPDGGTTVVLSDGESVADTLLRSWFVADILREPLPKHIHEVSMGYNRVLIWNDRVEKCIKVLRTLFPRETIEMEDAESVATSGRTLFVYATDDRMISIDTNSPATAEKAKEIVEARLEVYRKPALVAE